MSDEFANHVEIPLEALLFALRHIERTTSWRLLRDDSAGDLWFRNETANLMVALPD